MCYVQQVRYQLFINFPFNPTSKDLKYPFKTSIMTSQSPSNVRKPRGGTFHIWEIRHLIWYFYTHPNWHSAMKTYFFIYFIVNELFINKHVINSSSFITEEHSCSWTVNCSQSHINILPPTSHQHISYSKADCNCHPLGQASDCQVISLEAAASPAALKGALL